MEASVCADVTGETVQVTLQRDWDALERMAEVRRAAASRLLGHLLSCLPSGSRGTDLLAETTVGKLLTSVTSDMTIAGEVRNPNRLMDRSLLWLHEQEIIRLNKGLTVFRPAMTIRLMPERRGFVQSDFESLKLHYDEQILQIHVMAEYVQRGLGPWPTPCAWRWTILVCAERSSCAAGFPIERGNCRARPRRNPGRAS